MFMLVYCCVKFCLVVISGFCKFGFVEMLWFYVQLVGRLFYYWLVIVRFSG